MIDTARLLYIGVTLLGYPEREVWKMTLYKITRLFRYHKEYNPQTFKQEEDRPPEMDAIDEALGGF